MVKIPVRLWNYWCLGKVTLRGRMEGAGKVFEIFLDAKFLFQRGDAGESKLLDQPALCKLLDKAETCPGQDPCSSRAGFCAYLQGKRSEALDTNV